MREIVFQVAALSVGGRDDAHVDAPDFRLPHHLAFAVAVGESPGIWQVRDEATGIGKGNDHVLILGESGSGKTPPSRERRRSKGGAAGKKSR